MANKLLLSGISAAVAVAATLSNLLVAALPAALFAVLFTLGLGQAEPVLVIAVAVSSLLAGYLALRDCRRKGAPEESQMEPVHLLHRKVTEKESA